MTTANTLVSMIMAMRPNFRCVDGRSSGRLDTQRLSTAASIRRSKSDRLAFAVHTNMIAEGFKLEAVGEHAERASSAGM